MENGLGVTPLHLMPAQTIAQKMTEKNIYFVFLLTEFLKNLAKTVKNKAALLPHVSLMARFCRTLGRQQNTFNKLCLYLWLVTAGFLRTLGLEQNNFCPPST